MRLKGVAGIWMDLGGASSDDLGSVGNHFGSVPGLVKQRQRLETSGTPQGFSLRLKANKILTLSHRPHNLKPHSRPPRPSASRNFGMSWEFLEATSKSEVGSHDMPSVAAAKNI